MHAKNTRGSTLIETLIALAILATALVFVFTAMVSFITLNGRNQVRTHAAAAARTRMEQLRFTDPASFPTSGTQSSTASVGPHAFTIITEFCSNASYCDDTTRHVVVEVQEDGQKVFETETVLTQLR